MDTSSCLLLRSADFFLILQVVLWNSPGGLSRAVSLAQVGLVVGHMGSSAWEAAHLGRFLQMVMAWATHLQWPPYP